MCTCTRRVGIGLWTPLLPSKLRLGVNNRGPSPKCPLHVPVCMHLHACPHAWAYAPEHVPTCMCKHMHEHMCRCIMLLHVHPHTHAPTWACTRMWDVNNPAVALFPRWEQYYANKLAYCSHLGNRLQVDYWPSQLDYWPSWGCHSESKLSVTSTWRSTISLLRSIIDLKVGF